MARSTAKFQVKSLLTATVEDCSPSQVDAATVGKPQKGGDIVARPYSQGVFFGGK